MVSSKKGKAFEIVHLLRVESTDIVRKYRSRLLHDISWMNLLVQRLIESRPCLVQRKAIPVWDVENFSGGIGISNHSLGYIFTFLLAARIKMKLSSPNWFLTGKCPMICEAWGYKFSMVFRYAIAPVTWKTINSVNILFLLWLLHQKLQCFYSLTVGCETRNVLLKQMYPLKENRKILFHAYCS